MASNGCAHASERPHRGIAELTTCFVSANTLCKITLDQSPLAVAHKLVMFVSVALALCVNAVCHAIQPSWLGNCAV